MNEPNDEYISEAIEVINIVNKHAAEELKKCEKRSVGDKVEEGQTQHKDGKNYRRAIAIALAVGVFLGGVAVELKNKYGSKIIDSVTETIGSLFDNQQDDEIDKMLGFLATGEYESIIDQNTEIIHSYALGHAVTSYDYNGIANCIISISEKSPELFDLAFYRFYDCSKNSMDAADKVWAALLRQSVDSEVVSDLLKDRDLENCELYLDYLIKILEENESLDANSDFYNKLLEVRENYKANGRENRYYDLSDDDKEILNKFIKNYYERFGEKEEDTNLELLNELYESLNSDIVVDDTTGITR